MIERERRGDYLGGTIQTVPHVTDLVKERVRGLAEREGVDVLIVEVGGTVGDIEGQAFLEAIRQMRYEEPRNGTLAIHVTPLFHLKATDELKTKPTQHSVRTLRSMGIQPDIIISRTDIPADSGITDKLALFCDVPAEAVMTLETASSIYQVPAILERAGLTDLTLERLGLTARPAQLGRSIDSWLEWTDRLAETESRLSRRDRRQVRRVARRLSLGQGSPDPRRPPSAAPASTSPGSSPTILTTPTSRKLPPPWPMSTA